MLIAINTLIYKFTFLSTFWLLNTSNIYWCDKQELTILYVIKILDCVRRCLFLKIFLRHKFFIIIIIIIITVIILVCISACQPVCQSENDTRLSSICHMITERLFRYPSLICLLLKISLGFPPYPDYVIW